MDIQALAALSEKARRFNVTAGDVTLSCVLPTRLAERELAQRHLGADGRWSSALFARDLFLAAVTGWSGARFRHLVPGAGEDPLPCSPEALALAAQERTDWVDAVSQQADRLFEARRDAAKEDEKNLPGASAGN